MGEAASEERLAELNRNKERYEQQQEEQKRGEERELRDETRENQRRLELQRQREEEERERKREVEASASRIAAGRKRAREEKEREKKEVEESAKRIAEGRKKYREEQQKKETEASAERIAQGRMKYRAEREKVQEEDSYRRNTPLKSQLLDSMFGRKEKQTEQVKPISTLGGAVAHKAKKRLGEAKDSFFADLARPAKSIQEGRKVRAQRNTAIVDPFMQAAPPRRKRSRRSDARAPVRQGTGFLFTEGFAMPPVSKGRKKSSRRGRGGVGDLLL